MSLKRCNAFLEEGPAKSHKGDSETQSPMTMSPSLEKEFSHSSDPVTETTYKVAIEFVVRSSIECPHVHIKLPEETIYVSHRATPEVIDDSNESEWGQSDWLILNDIEFLSLYLYLKFVYSKFVYLKIVYLNLTLHCFRIDIILFGKQEIKIKTNDKSDLICLRSDFV